MKAYLEFLEQEIAPYNSTYDAEKRFPSELINKLGEAGYLGLVIPESYGGGNASLQEYLEFTQALAEAMPTLAIIFVIHSSPLKGLQENDNEDMRQIVYKDVIDNHELVSGAHSEKSTGISCISEFSKHSDDDVEVFTGQKNLITAAGYSKYYFTNLPDSEEGETYWIIPRDSDGLSFEQNTWNGFGMRGNIAAPITFNQVKLPRNHKVGPVAIESTLYFNLGLGAVAAGIGRKIYQIIFTHTKSREFSGGKTLADIETVQNHLSKLYQMQFASSSTIETAAQAYENNDPDFFQKALAARVIATENAIEIARIAMRIGGGYTYNMQNDISMYLRDAYAGQVMVPGVDLLNQIIIKTELNKGGN